MNSDLYALIALAARYWFVALIVMLLFRGWRMTVADNRRAKLLREWMGQTGCVGELILNPGSKKRVSYPIPREGVLGRARSADVRIRHRDIERAHAHFELREGGLLIRPLGRAELTVGGGFTGEAVFLQDGDVLTVGKLQLMLVLFDAPAEEEDEDEWFEVEPGAGPADGEADEPCEMPPAAARARRLPEDEDGRPAPQPARRVRKVSASLDGQFTQSPLDQPRQKPAKRGRKASADYDLPFDPTPVSGRSDPAPDGEEWMNTSPAGKAVRPKAKHTATSGDDEWMRGVPAVRIAGKGVSRTKTRRAQPGSPDREEWMNTAPAEKNVRAKARRARPTSNDDFRKDATWPDL